MSMSTQKYEPLRESIKKVIIHFTKNQPNAKLDPRTLEMLVDIFVATIELMQDVGAGKLNNPKGLIPYLTAKGIVFANLTGKQQAQCGASIASLILGISTTGPVLLGAGPAGWVALVGLTLIDGLDIGDKCYFIYENYKIEKAVEKQRELSAIKLKPMPGYDEFINLGNQCGV